MNNLVVSGLVLLGLLLLAILWRRGRKGRSAPYELQDALFSPAERAFLGVLELAVGERARVFAKVRVVDVLTPKARMSKRQWQQAFNKISAKHVDYLLCDPVDLSFLCAVELDDSSHRQKKRKARDAFLKSACEGAGLPLLQIPASSHYQVEELREQLLPLLSQGALQDEPLPGERREPTFSPLLLDGVDLGGEQRGHQAAAQSPRAERIAQPAQESGLGENLFGTVDEEDDEEGDAERLPHCPRCDAPLVEREAKKGPHAGRLFLACSRFPQCRYAAPRGQFKH